MRVLYLINKRLDFTWVTFVLYQRQISSPETAIFTAIRISRVATPLIHLNVTDPVKNKKRSIKKKKLNKWFDEVTGIDEI